jgi:PAS domain-containing protein
MTFENYAVQHRRELFFDFTQFEPILLPELSSSTTSRTSKNNKPVSVGQMVVNNEGKIVSLNPRFISIWKLPQHVVQARCEWQLFQFIAEQLENPQSFLIDIRNVHEQMNLEIQSSLKLKDGRTFLHLMKSQRLEQKIVGRIYRFSSLL